MRNSGVGVSFGPGSGFQTGIGKPRGNTPSKLHLPLIVALCGLPFLALAAPKPCTDPLRAWETEARNVDAANRTAKAGQQKPLPSLVLDGGHLDCLKDDVLVINGEAMANLPTDLPDTPPGPLVRCPNLKDMNQQDPANCFVDYNRALKRALDLIGPVPESSGTRS